MAVEISDDDHVSRCIIFPQLFANFVHTDEVLWLFGQSDASGAAHQSGVLRSLAPNLSDVHEIGCKIAAGQNERLNNPPPGDNSKRRYYCGCRTARVGDIPKETDSYVLVMTNDEEFGVAAHVDFALKVKGETRSERANNRTSASLIIAESFDGADPHVCDCDKGDRGHPVIRYGPLCLSTPKALPEQILG